VLLSLQRLERLALFRLENLNAFKVSLEQTLALASEWPSYIVFGS
jgi:hypothetical protein